MKIYAVFALCFCLILPGGCIRDKRTYTTDEQPAPEISGEMRFDISSLHTRVHALYDASEIKSMGVFGYSTGFVPYSKTNPAHTPNIFWNQKVVKNGNDWVYSPKAYWPVDPAVNSSFFAYSPYVDEFKEENRVVVSERGASGHPTLRYTLPIRNMDNMFDIVYAAPRLNVNRHSPGVTNGIVEYEMRHSMSGIAFLITGVNVVDENGEVVDDERNNYELNWLAFMADRIPITCTLDLGYVPVSFPDDPSEYDHSADYYGSGAWGQPEAYSGVYYELINYDAGELEHDHGITITPGKLYYPPDDGYENTLFFFPKDITREANVTVDAIFVVDDVEYYYYIEMPATYMHAGLVTVFVVSLSKDGISLQFKEHNYIEDWIRGNEGKPEIVEMF